MRATAVLALTLALAGCGGGSSTLDVKGSTVTLRLDEYRIRPHEVHVDGPRVRLVARDEGILTHNVKIFSTTKVDADGKPIQLDGTPTAHPGETVSATISLAPGRYRMACSIANHDDLGMHGILVVGGRT